MSSTAPTPASRYTVKCGRCAVIFGVNHCAKLDHFSIFRVDCPHCGWPGRYLASELHAAQARPAAPARRGRVAAPLAR
ncbi:MAG: hypothetical protein ACRD1M_10720, partial [Terriglobales bacterium]